MLHLGVMYLKTLYIQQLIFIILINFITSRLYNKMGNISSTCVQFS